MTNIIGDLKKQGYTLDEIALRLKCGEVIELKERIEKLEDTFRHPFVSPEGVQKRFCRECGLYLTDDVHERAELQDEDKVNHISKPSDSAGKGIDGC